MKLKHIVITLLLAASTGWAGPIEDAAAAYKSKNYVAAAKGFRLAAAQGNATAQVMLGEMYANGQGVVQDDAEAVKWFRLAAAQGNASAQYGLGFVYANGQGVVQNYAEAVKWYRLAAAQGSALAQFNLGVRYFTGQGVIQDYVNAHMWFNIASVRGDSDAIKARDLAANKMTPQQIAEAQKRASECLARDFKGCN